MDRDVGLNKLVRLTTQDRNCIFDAQFDEELYIQPQTEIALKSASVALTGATEFITGGDGNNIVSVFHGSTNRQIEVTPGMYGRNNIDDLFTEMTTKLNGSMTLGENPLETNYEYQIGINDASRVEVQSIKIHTISPTGTGYYDADVGQGRFWTARGTEVSQESSVIENDGVLTRSATAGVSTEPNYRATNFADFSFTGGCGFWRSTINQIQAPLAPNLVSGFCIGFVSDRNLILNGTITDADVVCGVRIQATQASGIGNFEYKASAEANFIAGTETIGTVTAGNPALLNDTIEWQSTRNATDGQHQLRCFLHRNGVAAVELGASHRIGVLAANKPLFGFYALYMGSGFNDITQVEYAPSFFVTPMRDDTQKLLSKQYQGLLNERRLKTSNLATLAAQDYGKFRQRMVIDNNVLKERIMGFDPRKYTDSDGNAPAINTVYDITDFDLLFPRYDDSSAIIPSDYYIPFDPGLRNFKGVVAPEISFAIFGSQNYIVELLNLPLNSYDSFDAKRGRANILAVIPENEHNAGNIDNVLMYEPNEMTYISLTNKSELSLRNIRARITFPDYTPIDTVGLSTLVLHLRPPK